MDSSSCRLLYEQLVILFHDHHCEECDGTDNVMKHFALPPCRSADTLISHMKHCRAGMSCRIPSCRSARIIVSHWKVCRKEDCPLLGSLSDQRKEWTQKLAEQFSKCSSISETNRQAVKIVHQNLFVALHVRTCARMQTARAAEWDCALPQCQSMRSLLKHFRTCTARRKCPCGKQVNNVSARLKENEVSESPVSFVPIFTGPLPDDMNTQATIPAVPQDSSRGLRRLVSEQWMRKSWKSWKRCEGFWIRRHPYRHLGCKSLPARLQHQRRGINPTEVPSTL
ncbi:uncharacterized protein LOC142097325 isoform X2 [Mixophyes fleayi]|uniref:uncharacterized protein LOC142097325 isoform X2 n=1 Tax=Mixophyes fleayi TaxID=3061075 RepID=UPI003F4DD03E